MRIHVIGDTVGKLSMLRATLPPQYGVSSELLSGASLQHCDIDAVVVAADLRNLENISALKQLSAQLSKIRRRLFLIENTRVSIAQAYALGATQVLPGTLGARLAAELTNSRLSPVETGENKLRGRAGAAEGAASIASMFRAVLSGAPVDVEGARNAGRKIADTITEHGLSDWLASVRRHHEGTYQHCLLVTGVAVDFGLSSV